MSTDKMTIRDQLEESPYKAGLIGMGFNNPLTSEGICQVLGRDPGVWSNRIVSAINNTYGANINPEAVPELLNALKKLTSFEEDFKADREKALGYRYELSILTLAKAAIEKAKL